MAIFVSDTATTFKRAGELDERVAVALRLERVLGLADVEAGRLDQVRPHPGGELLVGVQSGTGRGPAQRDLRDLRQRAAHPARAEADLRGVAGELLPERHRDGVHQVRATGLDDVMELGRLRAQRLLELLERRQQGVGRRVERREVHGGGEHVVGRLPHVHVIVGMGAIAGERRDHLVGVHVRRSPRAGLEHVDRELVVELAGANTVRGGGDPLGQIVVEQS